MEKTFHKAIRTKDFTTALQMVNNGDDLLRSDFIFKIEDSFKPLLINEGYDVLNAMIENDIFSMDIFDYDSFNNTIFEAVFAYLPSNSNADAFFSDFISKIENLDESVGDKTLITLAIDKLLPVDKIETLINSGCDLQYANNAEKNFAHYISDMPAVYDQDRRFTILEFLIASGLDIFAKDLDGNTPLHIAVKDRFNVSLPLLLDNGLDPAEINNKGFSSFQIANNSGNIEAAEILNNYGSADEEEKLLMANKFISQVHSDVPSESDMSKLNSFGKIDIYAPVKDFYGNETTIVSQMCTKSYEWFKLFADSYGFDVGYSDNSGNTILHTVCAFDLNFDSTKSKDTYRKAKLLLKMGADPRALNNSDQTPIDLASLDNLKEKVVALLLKEAN